MLPENRRHVDGSRIIPGDANTQDTDPVDDTLNAVVHGRTDMLVLLGVVATSIVLTDSEV